jgi:hypothetical protein
MTLDNILFVYVVVLLGALVLLAIYSERRQRWFGPRPSDDHVFRCIKCGYVYTDDPDVDRSRCQQCGTLNEAIKF